MKKLGFAARKKITVIEYFCYTCIPDKLVFPSDQTPTGDIGSSPSNPVVETLRRLSASFPSLLLACDVCLCPYTDHGHCGVLEEEGHIDLPSTLKEIAAVAASFARAGAHVVAPSDMMDGRVKVGKKRFH